MFSGDSRTRSRPSNWICPADGLRNPVSILKSVVFPEPLGPRIPNNAPWLTLRSTLSPASRPSNDFESPETCSMAVTSRWSYRESLFHSRRLSYRLHEFTIGCRQGCGPGRLVAGLGKHMAKFDHLPRRQLADIDPHAGLVLGG